MCLKKWVKYTFSNREAFNRLTKMVDVEYGQYLPKGEIYVMKKTIKTFDTDRNSLTYEELMSRASFYIPTADYDYYSFVNWEEWNQTKKDVGDNQDVFGYVKFEVQ